MNKSVLFQALLIVLLFYLFILQIQAIWPFTIDDMYISLRYARHWAAGDGLLWNLHAPPVEGYSNFSFVALGALSLLLKLDPVTILKAAGLIGLFFTCVFIFLITRFWFERRESLLPCIGLLLYKGQIIWAVSGLETTVYQAFICAAVYFSFRGLGYRFFPQQRGPFNKQFLFGAGVSLSLAGLTRPEAPALMALFFVLIWWDTLGNTRIQWRSLIFLIMPIALLYLPWFFWRWHYYGLIFPNTVYCKRYSQEFSSVLDKKYLALVWPFMLLSIPAWMSSKDKRHYFLWLPGLVYLIMLWGSDPIVAFDNRLFLAPFVLLFPLVLKGLSELILWYFKNRNIHYFQCLYLASVCFAFTFIPGMTLSEYRYFTQSPLEGEQLRQEVIHWLRMHSTANDVVVLSDSGMIPYYSTLNFTDSYCLNNKIMAQYPEKYRYERFCKQTMLEKPQVIILTSLIQNGKLIYTPGDQCLKSLFIHTDAYRLIKTLSTRASDSMYRYELFARTN